MRKIKEILRLKYELGLSIRQIKESCSISHGNVINILNRAKVAGLSWPLPDNLDDAALEKMLYPVVERGGDVNRNQPDMAYIHQELQRKNVTLQLLWEEYKQQHPNGYQYSWFCESYQQWRGKLNVSMPQVHRAGEKLCVDWVGQTVPIIDPKTGEKLTAYIFIATLAASNYTYVEAFLSLEIYSWIMGHCHAFTFFDGVSNIIVPDNLKTGVTKACYYEPEIHPTYLEMATHYGTVIIPARVRKPKDKSKVENAVLVVERWILAALRNSTFFSLAELNDAIREKTEVLNNKPFQKLPGSRRELFETLEKSVLKPLPSQPYEFALWKHARVNIDYHVEYNENYYSVPYQLIKEKVELRITANVIEVLHKGHRVASHQVSHKQRHYVTDDEHRPEAHRKYSEWTPERLIHWAEAIGPNTANLIKAIFDSKLHPEQGFRSCLGIMRLGKSYSIERMEAATGRALACRAISYTSIKSILKKGLDQIPLPVQDTSVPISHVNIRGAKYYQH